MQSLIKLARTKQWTLRVTLKGCCIVRACDDEQGSSSPTRYECSEQGDGARAQGSSPALCRALCAMGDGRSNGTLWARERARAGRPAIAALRTTTRGLERASDARSVVAAAMLWAGRLRASVACLAALRVAAATLCHGHRWVVHSTGLGRKPKCSSCHDCRVLKF